MRPAHKEETMDRWYRIAVVACCAAGILLGAIVLITR